MSRLAAPGDPVPLDAERAEDDAEREIERLEDRPLLDVELEVGGGASRARDRASSARVEVDAVRGERVGKRDAVAVRELAQLVLVGHRAGGRARAEEAAAEARALLVGPVDEPHRDRRRPFVGDAPQHLGAGDDVEAAVEPAAVRHRVDVAADEDGALRLAGEREPLVAGRVDRLLGARCPRRSSRSHSRARSHVSVQATRCAPSSSPVSSRSSFSSATVRFGSSATARL